MYNPEYIIARAQDLPEFAPVTIHRSYKIFLDYFSRPLSDNDILAGAYMVYGWMPTMLRLKGPIESIFRLVREGRRCGVDISALDDCSKTLNNSLVGTSKLLHFIAPDYYPIWDSRVYRALYNKAAHPYRVEDARTYLNYLDWVVSMEQCAGFQELKCRFQKEAGYEVSSKRAAEAVLYVLGPKPKKRR